MDRKLKPYTIVPANLYVERSADRQVENIIQEMGRPGYVLVSRQMGKTNLLLNARRKFTNENDKFVYVDLSNLFYDELTCFRNIIDLAIETNLDAFSSTDLEIENFRLKFSHLPPQKQHEGELRILLKAIKGKLIIVLDEIDALTKTDYSDQIFSQIRSIYFARANYEEFDRLTYLLSGVVEPSDLIKNPKISPFNIGEKIFLNDFNKSEYQEFLKKAGLGHLSDGIQERVYYWANGNPRLTWDLLSLIEGNDAEISEIMEIDEIVKKHYLTQFDKPPIDNIREIVKSDKSLQDALIEMEYGKGKLISDQLKQKLYLSGIVNFSEDTIVVKNRIIKQSLSVSWIESLIEDTTDYLGRGIDYYNKSVFKLAIENLIRSVGEEKLNLKNANLATFYLGLSYYYDNQFENSKSELLKVDFDKKEFGNFYLLWRLHLGYLFIKEKDFDNAWAAFVDVVDLDLKNDFYASAKINLIQIAADSDDVKLQNIGKVYLKEVITSKVEDFILQSPGVFFESKFTAFKLSKFLSIEDFDTNEQIIYLKSISNDIPNESKANFNLALYEITSEKEEKLLYLNYALNSIFENKLTLHKNANDFESKFDVDHLRKLQIYLFASNKISDFDRLIDYEDKIRSGYSKEKILDKLVGFAQEIDRSDDFIFSLAEYFYINYPPHNSLIKRNLLTLLSSLSFSLKRDGESVYITSLLDFFVNNDQNDLTLEIITLLLFNINQLLENNETARAYYLIRRIQNLEERVPKEIKDAFLIVSFFELIFLKKTGKITDAKIKAAEILERVNRSNAVKSNSKLLATNLPVIVNECNQTLDGFNIRVPLVKDPKPERNKLVTVRYMDGKEVVCKFKKIEKDYENGSCVII
ncbi:MULTISPECIES: AAA-like domain-containing protein [Sphingobacterium]|uniref:AAA-like domain-containing protein n=1 Tax=Sphingobacterium TaxID=28453 RepID=UPI00257BEE6D|nr:MULTISPECIES: AAA-like domain-containing protein [Sphingobacterium]